MRNLINADQISLEKRLTRCCGADVGEGLFCCEDLRCRHCSDKYIAWQAILRLTKSLAQIANGDGVYGAQANEYKQIARAALQEE